MSFRVLVIPEDPTLNGYLLRPLVGALMADAGKPAAKIEVLTSPRLKGYDHAVSAIRDELSVRYGHYDLWLFFPDADRAGTDAMQALEQNLAASKVLLLCCPAEPELEIYPCLAFRDELGLPWQSLRRHTRLKEEVFLPLLKQHGDVRRAGGGRDVLIAKALENLPALYQFCPELQRLRDRIKETFSPG